MKFLLGRLLTKLALGLDILDTRGLEQDGNFILVHVLLASSIGNLLSILFYQSNLNIGIVSDTDARAIVLPLLVDQQQATRVAES